MSEKLISKIWKTWSEALDLCKQKQGVIYFGRSEDWIHKTAPRFNHIKNQCIVDSNPAYENTEYFGMSVYSQLQLSNDKYIIITGTPYEQISQQLIDKGFIPGKDFCISPVMRDWHLLHYIRSYEQQVVLSCQDYTDTSQKRFSKMGGGIYTYDLGKNLLERKVEGQFRQMIQTDNLVLAVEFVKNRIYVLDKGLNVMDTSPLIGSPNSCGIAYHPNTKQVFIANTGSDSICIYDLASWKLVDTFEFSNKFASTGNGQHHINNICIAGDSLYVSYFSWSGNWKKGIMDGGIAETTIPTTTLTPVVTNVWMPHSVEYLHEQICYLSSMTGGFYIGTEMVGKFPGFMCGLTCDDRFYYIGQSECMYMSRLFGVSDNIMVNAGFYLFDVETKVSRFYSCPDLSNIHDLLVIK